MECSCQLLQAIDNNNFFATQPFDLSVKNPNKAEESLLREPQEILDAISLLDEESAEILAGIGGML